jgi:hypothetical protein
MPEGYSGASEGTRLGEQDQARRRGSALEGLGASRESARSRSQDREGLGPVKRRRGPGTPGGARKRSGARPGGSRRPRTPENVDRQRAEETPPPAEPQVESPPVAEDTTPAKDSE